MKKRNLIISVLCALSIAVAGCGGGAKTEKKSASNGEWKPKGAISLIVPAGAGGDTDLSARVFAKYAKEKTGYDFVVVNAKGAAGSVASNQVRAAKPDGTTILYGHELVNVANIAGVTDFNYTAFKVGPTFAMEPAQQLYVMSEKYKNLKEFIDAAKKNPGKLKACTEVGAYTYYELLAFQKAAGIQLDLVDAGSTSDKITAMLSGTIDLMPGPYVNTKDYLTSGKFVMLGAPTDKRYDLIKNYPTLKEQGINFVYPNQEFKLYFPKDTPDNIVAWFDKLTKSLLDDENVKKSLGNLSIMPCYKDPKGTEKHEKETFDTIKKIADELGKK
jgi:tripartite-type tricarboxylate transporter receptor subunit TctC